ncbi:DUF2878 domain-containing protein [Kangiella sp. HD9-110m-PIT-SAG07]|nr:DUF2878 domain-containing protein [Kangiella sp. HD9-110m-PIT-SAG07]
MARTTISANNIVNFVLFQLVWIGFVFGAAENYIWVGCVLLVIMLTWQLWPTRRANSDFFVIGASAAFGFVLASAWSASGLIVYDHHWPVREIAPWWIVALWVVFGASFNHSLGWIQKSPYLAGLMAAIGGPVSYMAAERVGAVIIFKPFITLSLMAVGWFIIAFLLTILTDRYQQLGESWFANV